MIFKSLIVCLVGFASVGTALAETELPEIGPILLFKESALPADMAQPIIQEPPKKARNLKELFSQKKAANKQAQADTQAQAEQQNQAQAELPPGNATVPNVVAPNTMLPDKKKRANAPFIALPNTTPQIDQLIQKYADGYGVPVELVRRIVKKESGGNPRARNRNYYGLMQIAPATAQVMGFQGNAGELLDAETNLRFGVKYLRGAYIAADGDQQRAISYYQKGYYYTAKAKGLLEEVGLTSGPKSPKTVY